MVADTAITPHRFRDRAVIVSGALGGIGLATARRFAQEGASLVLADLIDTLSEDRASSAIATCKELGAPEALALACDVTDETQVDAVVDLALKRFGHIDVIANVAGFMMHKPLADLTGAEWRHVLGVNLMGAVFFTRQALRVMKPSSAIVNVSSIHAVRTSALAAPYAAAKAALLSLTRSTAIEGKDKGIRANAVLPGAVDTPMLWSNPNVASGAEKIAPEDVGAPEHIAAVIAFLASCEAASITGSAFTADSGRMASL